MNNIVFYSLLIIVFFCIIVFIKDRWSEGFQSPSGANSLGNTEESSEALFSGSNDKSKINYNNIIIENNSIPPDNSELNIIEKLYEFRPNSQLWLNSNNDNEYNLKFILKYKPESNNDKGYTIISGKSGDDDYTRWSLKLINNRFILSLDDDFKNNKKITRTESKISFNSAEEHSFSIMISYRIEANHHQLNCYISGELLQSESYNKLDYSSGHTVIFGSEIYPMKIFSPEERFMKRFSPIQIERGSNVLDNYIEEDKRLWYEPNRGFYDTPYNGSATKQEWNSGFSLLPSKGYFESDSYKYEIIYESPKNLTSWGYNSDNQWVSAFYPMIRFINKKTNNEGVFMIDISALKYINDADNPYNNKITFEYYMKSDRNTKYEAVIAFNTNEDITNHDGKCKNLSDDDIVLYFKPWDGNSKGLCTKWIPRSQSDSDTISFANTQQDFIPNSFPSEKNNFPHSIGDIEYYPDFKTAEEIIKIMRKEIVVCKYDPRYDTDVSDCIQKCQSNDACNINLCETICKSSGSILPNETKEELEPDPPKQIRLIPHNRALEIQFRKPKHQGLDSKIDKYIVMAKLKFVNDKNKNKETKLYTFNVFEEDFHKFTLKGLLNNQFYDISVLSHNDKDLTSKTSSETQTQAPVGDDQTEDDIPIQEYCYNPEYKFKSNIIDSAIVSDMYKDGQTFDKTLLNAAGVPLTEENEGNWKDDSAVQILSDLQKQFSFI